MTPREALTRLLRTIDSLETSNCPVCLKPSNLTDECAKHDPEWQKVLRDARESLNVKDD